MDFYALTRFPHASTIILQRGRIPRRQARTHGDKENVPQDDEEDEVNPRYFAGRVLRMPHYLLPAVQGHHLKRLPCRNRYYNHCTRRGGGGGTSGILCNVFDNFIEAAVPPSGGMVCGSSIERVRFETSENLPLRRR